MHKQHTNSSFSLPPIPDDDQLDTKPSSKQRLWHRGTSWVKLHKKASVIIAVAFVVLLGGGGVALYFALKSKPSPTPASVAKKEAPKPAPQAPKYYSPLTGLPVPDEATTKRQVTAVMIENSPAARPQSGILTSGVVFEAIAEAGITRFATLHQEDRPGLIGPVRSLRPYYLSWIAPFDAAIAHVGGSYNALNEVRVPGKYKDIDQFFNGSYYWRTTDREAPHNVYSNFDKLDELNKSKGFTSSNFTGFPRKTESPAATPNATSININISSDTYNVHYDYDRATNTYLRSEGGQPHNDREGGQLKPKVVIAMKVQTTIGIDDGPREMMTVNNAKGQAYIFEDGIVEQATWSKGDQKDQLHFLDPKGQDIKINPGQTWITATPTEQDVTWQ